MARISEDVNKVRMYVGPSIMYGINLITLFILVISYMVSVNAKLSFYVLLPLPILSISIYYVPRYLIWCILLSFSRDCRSKSCLDNRGIDIFFHTAYCDYECVLQQKVRS